MIEKIPDQIPVQTGEWRGTTFDIIPKETFAMACRKINELVDAVNGILDYAPLEMAMKAEKQNIDIGELAYLQKENGDLKDELERTRKALETIRLHLMAAKGRFNFYDEYLVSGIDTPHARFIKEEIEKALEQKDVK